MDTRKDLMPRQQSGISIIANNINDPSKHGVIIGDLSHSIKKAIESPSINQLIASGANGKELRRILAVLISKYANMLTVGGNLRPEHPMEYAEILINDNPSMSLDDFNILLSNGVKGKYNDPGKLFRFDISVIYGWIAAFQEEYWEVKESMPKEKSALELLPDEKLYELQKVIEQSEGLKPIRPINDKEIKIEGQEKIIRPKYIPPGESYFAEQRMRVRYGRECCDLYTGRVKEGMPSFEDWVKEEKQKFEH